MESHDKAAFFRLEGTITSRSTVAAAAWMASHAQAFSDRLSRLGAVALSTPFRSVLRDAGTATRLSWSAVRGMSEDRTILLGEEHYELFYRDAYKDSNKKEFSVLARPHIICDPCADVESSAGGKWLKEVCLGICWLSRLAMEIAKL